MKQFLIVGNINVITCKEVFPYLKTGEVKYRPQCIHKFLNGAAAATWYTTFTVPELSFLELTRTYNPVDYPKYDNYDAIEVSRTKDIPCDYPGVMGVPVTFLDKYCPEQFEILGTSDRGGDGLIEWFKIPNQLRYDAPTVDGIGIYKRLFIRHRKAQLMEYNKKFIVIGPMNAVTYKEIFPLIKSNQLWLGQNAKGGSRKGNSLSFVTNSRETKDISSWWFTNISNERRNTPLDLYKHYSNEYKHYDNYDAIEVSKSCDVPMDYDGVMGVPISFLDKYNPNQFEIIGMGEDNGTGYSGGVWLGGSKSCLVNGKAAFKRIFIKRK